MLLRELWHQVLATVVHSLMNVKFYKTELVSAKSNNRLTEWEIIYSKICNLELILRNKVKNNETLEYSLECLYEEIKTDIDVVQKIETPLIEGDKVILAICAQEADIEVLNKILNDGFFVLKIKQEEN